MNNHKRSLQPSPRGYQQLKNLTVKSLDFLLFSNLFISLCAVAQALVTYHLLNAEPDKYVLGLLFFATLAQYNVSILLTKPAHPSKSPFRRIRWIFTHYRLMSSLTIIAIVCLVPLAFLLSLSAKILVIILGVAAIFYNVPLFSISGRHFGLRNIPGIKLFMIAFIWAASCVLLPILEMESHNIFVSSQDTMLLIIKRFLFIAAITVPFDIRDLFVDKFSDLKTIPVIFGEKNSLLFCQVLLAAYLVLLFVFNPRVDVDFLALLLTVIVAGRLIIRSSAARSEYYYFLYLDGIMLLQWALLLTGNLIFNVS